MLAQNVLKAFVDDPTVRIIAVLVALDFVLGVLAAVKAGGFRLSFFADVFRNDLLGKVLPYYALWAAVHVSGIDWSIGGFDVIEETTGAIVIAALAGSSLNSLRDLGLLTGLSDKVAGPDPESPTPPPADS